MSDDLDRARDAGFHADITKPTDVVHMRDVIRGVLEA